MLIGAAVTSHQVVDLALGELIAQHFTCLTSENEFKVEHTEPEPGRFDFTAADRIAAFARAHNMRLVGHTLCWHQQAPGWMFQAADGRPLSRDEGLFNLKRHIAGVAGHFEGRVIGWDVVNEAISDERGKYLRDTPARRSIGDDYIEQAFTFAQAADPAAELYYNDYSNEGPEKRDKVIRLIRDLKARGCRVDAVGIQGHWGIQFQNVPAELDTAIRAYAAEGVKVCITELDVEVLPRQVNGADLAAVERCLQDPYTDGLPSEVAVKQAKYYEQLFKVITRHRDVVTRVTFWGTHDGTSWLNYWPIRSRTNYPLLWDRDLKPKPAFDAVLRALVGQHVHV